MKLLYAGLSEVGRVRERNEDAWMADPAAGLFIVSDGMGGHLAGNVASKAVVQTLPAMLAQTLSGAESMTEAMARVNDALIQLSKDLHAHAQRWPGLAGMGATVVLALFRGREAVIAHMGDSRAYRLRDSELEQLTKDHTILQLLIDEGEITAQEAKAHPSRGQLTRAVGLPGEPLPESQTIDVRAGDCLLLCTDGLTEMLSKDEIRAIVADDLDPRAACAYLIESTIAAGGRDNITALVVEVGGER